MAKAKDGKWIQGMHMKEGAFTAKAKKAGAVKKGGGIKASFTNKETKSSNPTTRKQANLAKTFAKMRKK